MSDMSDASCLGIGEARPVYSDFWHEISYDLGAVIVCHRMRAVAQELAQEIGVSRRNADLWAQQFEHHGYPPLANILVSDILNSVTPDKMIAWEWLSAEAGHAERSDHLSSSR